MDEWIYTEIERLRSLRMQELRARYRAVFGEDSRTAHKQHLVRQIAWRLQVQAQGDLSQRARQRALEIATVAVSVMTGMASGWREKWPQTFAELDFVKGIELSAGTCNGINVDKVSLYTNGIAVDTRSSTDDCEGILNDLFGAATELLGARIKTYRRMFVSQLVFQSEMRLTALNPVLQKIVDRLNTYVSADLEQPFVFDSNVVMSPDVSQTKLTPGAFTIERRADAPFKAKTYFSSAPLRTSVHLELLQEFEDALKGTHPSNSKELHKKPSKAIRLQEE